MDPSILDTKYPDAKTDYAPFYDWNEDFLDIGVTPVPDPERRSGAALNPDNHFDYNEPRHSGARLDVDLESTVAYPGSRQLPLYPELDSILLFPELEEEPSVASSVSEVYESPIEAVTAVLLRRTGNEDAPFLPEEDSGITSETDHLPIYPEGEVILESVPGHDPPFSHRRRVVGVEEDVSFNPDGKLLRNWRSLAC